MEATKRGIRVTNTTGVLTDTTADCAFALMMAISRRIVESDKYIRERKWIHAWEPKMFIGGDVHGNTLGIVGMGRIGSAMVPRAKGFNMDVIHYDDVRNL